MEGFDPATSCVHSRARARDVKHALFQLSYTARCCRCAVRDLTDVPSTAVRTASEPRPVHGAILARGGNSATVATYEVRGTARARRDRHEKPRSLQAM